MQAQQDIVLLDLRKLVRRFGGFTVINDVSLSIKKGEMRCIIGPNGAGKTTLFNLITGDLKPNSGKVVFQDQEITRLSSEKICRIGITRKFQTPTLFSNLKVIENILIAGYGKHKMSELLFKKVNAEDIERTLTILETIKLSERKDVLASNLSHGEKQWLEIGMLLRNDPKLLLLDEPTAGMTQQETMETATLIKNISKNLTTIVIEHDLKFLKEIGDNVTVLHNGEILAEGIFDEIEQNEIVKNVYLGRE
jgi:urea ABC transporter ATP-binding protein UrtD